MKSLAAQNPRRCIDDLPPLFLQRLAAIVPARDYPGVQETFLYDKLVSVRINTLKTDVDAVRDILKREAVAFQPVRWSAAALVLPQALPGHPVLDDLTAKGWLYGQALSSQLPVLALNPLPHERVLDVCAAPGSKTTQMAAAMNNQGEIVAIESVRGRFYKLRSVVELLGAGMVKCKGMDARRYRDAEGFDKILVDAPCSCEGRFRAGDPKTYAYWSPRKIKEMAQKQRGLLLAASRLLRPGGVLVYSTCTFAPEENEGAVDWLLRKTDGRLRLVPAGLPEIPGYPALTEWGGRTFDRQVVQSCRVLPGREMEGFFIARMVKEGTG